MLAKTGPWITLALALAGCGPRGPLPSGVTFVEGTVNAVIVESDGRRAVIYGDPRPEPEGAEAVLLTHHRRDVVWAARPLIDGGAKVYAPAGERALLEDVDSYWQAYYSEGRFHDYAQQSSRILAQPLRVDERVTADFALFDGALPVKVLETPGYTRDAVTYLFEVDGKRLAATGDLIWGDGQLHDLFSLQDAIPEANVRGYHGYAARAADVINSLRALQAENPDILLPSRGPMITNPQESIGKLIARLQTLFREYYKTDALRWYWGDDNLRLRASRVLSDSTVEWMPMANELREIPPRWMHKFNTSRLIVSDDGPAFLIDCGSDQVMQQIEDLRARGVFTRIEGIFVTHYHDDHTDRVQAMAEKCDCPVYAGPEVADILERPGAYRMPAMTDVPIANVREMAEEEKLDWHEYTFTYTYFPGQAVYHGGLKMERDDGEKFFFVGDSFSPSGLDDYCILNRHFLHPGLGHYRCLKIIRESDPQFWLVNQHIEPVFRYSPEQLDFMEATLAAKEAAIAEIVPWDDPNFGLDEQWARLYPYAQQATAGAPVELWAVVFNHADEEREFTFTPHAPRGWQAQPVSLRVGPREEGRVAMRMTPATTGLTVVTADVAMGDRVLKEWVEALVEAK
jgi:glyoxylase-like metal-dependent hydrolase (beta-lactamase superfamily II)